MKEGERKKAALILTKTSHFDRTLRYVPLKEYQALRTPFHFKMFSVASKVFAALVYCSERHSKKTIQDDFHI